jgi:hypothetical protein
MMENDGTAGMHAIFEPGWTWAVDEKPLLGHPDSFAISPERRWRWTYFVRRWGNRR